MNEIKVQHPVILSVSRATDIPAFYSQWFFNRLKAGYCFWKNPYSNEYTRIEFDRVKIIVFWSKNPRPLMPFLSKIREMGIDYYIQFTLNDYDADGFEPGLPPLDERVNTFLELSSMINCGRVIWRFDPMILTDKVTVDSLFRKWNYIADKIYGFTEKCVLSFVDIREYNKVARNMTAAGINYREWTERDMRVVANGISSMNEYFKFDLAACAERMDLTQYGIKRNSCIDSDLIVRLCRHDRELLDYLGYEVRNAETNLLGESNIPDNAVVISDTQYAVRLRANKDKGQRALCGCCTAKDIGSYNTCPHRCVYCYANSTPESAVAAHERIAHDVDSECLIL